MKAQQDSGHSPVAYCRARGLDPKYFTLWKHKLRGPGVSAETVEPTGADHLRHTKFAGLRVDKEPRHVIRET